MIRIRELRKRAGMKQKELARVLQIADSTLSYWEQGKFEPGNDAVRRIADYFQCSVDYLLGRTDEVAPSPLVIPGDLEGVGIAFHRGEFEDLTQSEVDKLAEFARFIKSQRTEEDIPC